MVKIINSSNETKAILQNVVSPLLSEGLNREFTFDFSTVIDSDKSQYLTYTNKIEVEDNYFNMVLLKKSRTQEGLFFDISCEHVSYDLLSANFTAGFTATGLFSAVATTLLTGTGFTVGTVQVTGNETISINESTNAFNVLKQLATLYSGELEFNKYQVNLLTRRGADRYVQFRYRKNLTNATVNIDARQKTAGVPKISYEVGVSELEFEQGFISDGVSSLEHFELGDTVNVIDSDLGINTLLRIVKHSYDTEQRMQGTVEISNFVDDLADTITNIQTTSVSKDNIYNGCSIGPENGFVAERSDQLVKTSMNATNGIEIDLRNTTTAAYTAVFYVQVDTATGTAKLYLAGNAEFTGIVRGSEIIGGSITIGSGSNVFKANGTDGIWLGNTAFSTAPFSVTLSGALTAQNARITGDILAGSTFTVATGSNTIRADSNGFYVGSSAFSTSPFRVTLSGSVTATDITMTGNSTITGGTITGGTIRTSGSGERIELSGNTLKTYDASNNLNGMVMEGNTSSTFTYGDLYFYDSGTKVLEFYNNLTGAGYTIRPAGSAALYLGTSGKTTYAQGTWDFNSATVNGLGVSGTIYTTASQTITVTNGIITNIV